MDALRLDPLGTAPTGASRILQTPFDAQALAVPPPLDLTNLLGGASERGASAPSDTLSAVSVAQEASLALLAVLNPSPTPDEATAGAVVTPDAPAPTPPELAIATAPSSNASTPTANTPAVDLPALSQAIQDGATTDFALQTALRFGSGVGTAAAFASTVSNPVPNPVRQPEAVLRTGPVQSQGQGAASGAFTRPQTAHQAIETYAPVAVSEAETQVDLLA
ncbi:hypothetical protein [Geothrix sp. 21YS21S-4]|uniref:hypothetical protein n=1 Tax=Geothrix sp. 21YS21S-4 TaxID=3068889 RepID=UPI0027BAC362|nr:hypothetical protein [Geothrix sp. 21YS21S-4]